MVVKYVKQKIIANKMEYMSEEGFGRLETELNELVKEKLPEAIRSISEARDKGDLSENFEYHAAKREQGRILGRIRFLQRVLAHARVMPAELMQSDCVRLLTRVEVTNLDNGLRTTYTIVSPHEANAREGKISVKSPVAKALMNKKAGDEVEARVPVGVLRFRIESVESI